MRRLASLLILGPPAVWACSAQAGETGCWFENGAVVAPAAIGAMAGDYVIDLSSPRTLLHIDIAQGNGFTDAALTLPVALAGQKVEAAPVAVASLDYRAVGFSTPILGVIGADVLDRYVVRLDFSPCRLDLDPIGARPGPSTGGLPVTIIGGVPTTPATASDGQRGALGPFALDTASQAGVRARGAPDAPRQRPAGRLAALVLDGQARRDVPAVVAGSLPPGVVGAIGMQVLAAYRLELDPGAGRLWLTPATSEAAKEKGPGVSARP